jgi:hypothetical protein
MRSVGSLNNARADIVEKVFAEKYGGVRYDDVGYDIEFPHFLVEVKGCLSWHWSHEIYRSPGRYLINKMGHKTFKREADKQGKLAVYVFVKIPRHDDGKIETNPNKWQERWLRWRDVDDLVRNPEIGKSAKNKWHGWGLTRYYYRLDIADIFGEDAS